MKIKMTAIQKSPYHSTLIPGTSGDGRVGTGGKSFRPISMRAELRRARSGIRYAERMGFESRKRDWPAVSGLD